MADVTTINSIIDYVTTAAGAAVTAVTDGSGNGGSGSAGSGSAGSGVHDGTVHDHVMTLVDDDSTSDAMALAARLHWVGSGVVAPIFVALGLIGNFLSIVVWSRPHMKSSTGRYLTALGVADFLVVVLYVLTDTIRVLHPEIDDSPAYAAFFAWLGYPLFFFFIICSIWFMVGVTVDRFIMVCLISKTKEFCNEKRANVGICLISVLCFLINMPHFWSFTIQYPDDSDPDSGNSSQPALVKTDFHDRTYDIYEFWVHCIFLVLAPWFSVFTLNMLIISQIAKTNRRNNSKKTAEAADKSRRSENQITRLLLVVSFGFLFLSGFQCITQCFSMMNPVGYDMVLVDEIYSITKLGLMINSSVNFLLYCVSGRRFRLELLRAIGWKKLDHALFSSSDHSSGSASGATGTTSGM